MNCNVNDDVNDVRNRTQPLDASPFSIDVQILDDFGTLVEGPMLNELDFNVTLSVSQTTNCGIESLPVRKLCTLLLPCVSFVVTATYVIVRG